MTAPRALPSPLRPRLIAVLVCVAGALALAGCSGGSKGATSTTSSTEPATTTTAGLPAGATPVGVRDLEVGQCFQQPEDDPNAVDRAVWSVACTDPHTHEVYSVIPYAGSVPKGGGYPGTTVVQDWAEQNCYAGFQAFVGRTWTTSSYDIETWWPSEESWGRSDRKVICTTFPSDGSTTSGTAGGSNA